MMDAGMWWNVLEAMPSTVLGGATFKAFRFSWLIRSLRRSAIRLPLAGLESMTGSLVVASCSGLGR